MQHLVRSTPDFWHALHPQLVSVCQSHPFRVCKMTPLFLVGPWKTGCCHGLSLKLMMLAGLPNIPVSINRSSDSVKNTKLTKENTDVERSQFKCFQGGGVRWGRDGHLCSLRSCWCRRLSLSSWKTLVMMSLFNSAHKQCKGHLFWKNTLSKRSLYHFLYKLCTVEVPQCTKVQDMFMWHMIYDNISSALARYESPSKMLAVSVMWFCWRMQGCICGCGLPFRCNFWL